MDSKLERKRIFVDRQVQGGIVARLLFLWTASTGLACLVWFGLQFFANPAGDLATHIAVAGRLVIPLILSFVVTLPIAALYLLRFTHRFAGPVLRLRRSMQELANGEEVKPLRFRDGDCWQELADEFNRICDTLSKAQSRINELETERQARTPNPTHAAIEEVEPATSAPIA